MLKDLKYLDSNAQIMKQQNKNVSDFKTSISQKQSSSTHQFIRGNKGVKIRITNSKDVKIMTTWLIGNTYFVFVVLIMAEFLMAKLEFMVVALFEMSRKAVRDFFFSKKKNDGACGFGLSERSTDKFDGECAQKYTPTACMTYNTVFLQARTWNAWLWLKSWRGQMFELQHLCAHKRIRHQVSHVIPLLVSTTPSLLQSTTRSTTWTARPSPRRRCTPRTTLARTSSPNYLVGKQR